jgi:hypothetical protein
MKASGDGVETIVIEAAPIASRFRRRKLRFSLLALLMFTCFAGATLGIAGRQWLHERAEKRTTEADLAAFQGRWELQSPRMLLVIRGNDFMMSPIGTGTGGGYGKTRIDVTRLPKTADFDGRPFGVGPGSRMTFGYSFENDRLVLRLVGESLPDGSYTAIETASELIAVRVPPNGSPSTNGNESE